MNALIETFNAEMRALGAQYGRVPHDIQLAEIQRFFDAVLVWGENQTRVMNADKGLTPDDIEGMVEWFRENWTENCGRFLQELQCSWDAPFTRAQ